MQSKLAVALYRISEHFQSGMALNDCFVLPSNSDKDFASPGFSTGKGFPKNQTLYTVEEEMISLHKVISQHVNIKKLRVRDFDTLKK